jgi:hypothetical protein
MKIGLIGAPGSGKDDVVAHVLCNKYGFIKFAFADQIKKCYYNEIGITDEYFKSCRGTPEEEKIRKGLWEFSDKMREEHGHDFFIDPVIKNVVKTNNAVITDIRTKDELIASVGLKPKIIIITRNYNPTEVEFYHNMFPETRIPNRWIYSFLQKGFEEIFFKFDNNFNTLEEAREGFALFYKKIGGI